MARARNIKPSIMANEELAEMEPMHRLMFIYLWMLADREGRVEDRPKRISAQAFPYDQVNADSILCDLEKSGFIKRYESCGVKVISVVNFLRHQSPHGTEKDSELPNESGTYTRHKRGKNGYATGEKQEINCLGEVVEQTPNNDLTVKERPDILIPDSGFTDSLIPELNTAAPSALDGKPSSEDVPLTTKEEIWKAGKSILEAAGVPKAQCGSFVGKLVKDYGDDVVVEAVRQTVLDNPADPREYLKALCMRAKGRKPKASMPKPENFANKDYGQGIRLL